MSLRCPVCLSLRHNPWHVGHSFCQSCGHIWQTDLQVTADYAGEYAAKTYDTYPETTAYLRAGFILGAIPLLAETKASIVDVGYGNGSFLKVMRKAGLEVFGIDVHGRDHGIPEVTFDVGRRFDVITFHDSLEHLPDLEPAIGMMADRVVVSIPERPAWFLQRPQEWRHFKPGEHLHYFSPESITALWRRAGYRAYCHVHHEDITRGHLPSPGHPEDIQMNIGTYVFER